MNFETMTIHANAHEYLLAVDRERGKWFVKLTRVFMNGTSRSAEAFVRAAASGRIDEETLELRETALAAWRKANPGAQEDAWEHQFELNWERGLVREHAERRSRELTTRERLEDELFAAKNLEWIRVPPAEEGWIEASYQFCVSFFRENPWLEPGMANGHVLGRSSETAWTPPQHATSAELRASWNRVERAMKPVLAALLEEDPSFPRDAPERFVEPWSLQRT